MKTNGFLIAGAIALAALTFPASAQTLVTAARGLAPKAVTACTTPRVVGGEPVCINEWPWQIALYKMKDNDPKTFVFLCGGSSISDRWVLTAAHCFGAAKAPDASKYRVLTGQTKAPATLPPGPNLLPVTNIVRHENYHDGPFDKQPAENDIALMYLGGSAKSKPVVLPAAGDPGLEAPGKLADFTGFGQLRPTDKNGNDAETGRPLSFGQIIPERLMHVQMPIVGVAECAKANAKASGIVDARTLCAGFPQGGKDTCQGDSGGPMVVRRSDGSWIQIGVVSWGVGCAKAGLPGIYTRVSAFAPWIKSKVGRDIELVANDPAPVPQPDPMPAPNPQPTPVPDNNNGGGGTASDAQFDNAAGLAIEINAGDSLKVGQSVAFRASTQKEGYLVLFDISADDKITQIFPNAASLRTATGNNQRSNLVTPDRPLLVPNSANPFEGFRYAIDPPQGKGMILGILSETPLTSVTIPDKPKTMNRAEAQKLIGAIVAELQTKLVQKSATGDDKPKWSVVFHPYVIE